MQNKPYHLLAFIGVILFLTSFLFIGKEMNIRHNAQDLIMTKTFAIQMLSLVTFSIWGLYSLIEKVLLWKTLTWFHVIATILTLFFLIFCVYGCFDYHKRYFSFDSGNFSQEDIDSPNKKLLNIIINVVAFGQLIFVVNLLLSLLKVKPTKESENPIDLNNVQP